MIFRILLYQSIVIAELTYIKQIMLEKSLKWKDIGKSAKPLHKLLQNGKDLPRKYTPTKARSHSVDVLFNTSRQRTNNSIENTLNISKNIQESSTISKLLKERGGATQKKSQNISSYDLVKTSLIKMPTVQFNKRTTSNNSQKYEITIVQMKKEFRQFKENVLEELKRQRQLIHTMTQQIYKTMEEQFRKLFSQNQKQKAKQHKEINHLELQMSSNLNIRNPIKLKPNIVQKQGLGLKQKVQQRSKGQKQLVSLAHGQIEKRQPSNPSENDINIKNLLGGLSTLKKQLFQMDKLFEGVIEDDSKAIKK